MIRKFKGEDTVKVMTIWTKGNFYAHPFIERDYWISNYNKVKEEYLKQAETYIYEEIPAWIMQGYGTMALEADEQFGERPTHVFVQAGVGSLAGAMVGYFANKYKDNPPVMVVVEAEAAACLYKGAVAGDGKIRIVEGDLNTIMAGLACGEPNITSWDILKNHADCFIAAEDVVAARGMRMLSAPLKGDPQVVSGESGAAPFGALATIMLNDEYAELRKKLKLDSNSKVLLFSTEGDTDPIRWKNIIWEAKER